ncbi:UNVERIFIED_ORG: threonine/homoserine/homoserine lactone efflux protein [Bacillus proteolyticus]
MDSKYYMLLCFICSSFSSSTDRLLLTPKIAILYVSLLPQFEDPEKGSLLFQGAVLGLTQIIVSFIVNLVIVCTASKIAKCTRPTAALAYGKCFNGACCTSCF